MIITEIADTFVLLIDTAVLWVRVLAAALAFVVAVVAFAVGPLVVPGVRAVRRQLPRWARGRVRARLLARATCSKPRDYEEAA